jgi:hypothetical protein
VALSAQECGDGGGVDSSGHGDGYGLGRGGHGRLPGAVLSSYALCCRSWSSGGGGAPLWDISRF